MDLLRHFRETKDGDEHLKPLNKMYMCHWGLQRSAGIQRAYKQAGKKVEIFPGGSANLVNMSPKKIKETIGNNTLYFINDRGNAEDSDFQKAEKILQEMKINYIQVDTTALNILCYDLTGSGLDEFML